MRRTTPPLLCLLLLATAGCTIGTRGENLPLAHAPRGASVELELEPPSTAISGELLEVQQTGLLVLAAHERVTFVPYARIRRGTVETRGAVLGRGRTPARATSDAMRLISRFPQGLDTELRAALLRAYNQTEVDEVNR
jgi:hypothetical protein